MNKITLLKYFKGLGHKSSFIISAICKFMGKTKWFSKWNME
jgi:hypothetical protein